MTIKIIPYKHPVSSHITNMKKRIETINAVLTSRDARIKILLSSFEEQKSYALKQTPSKKPDFEYSLVRQMFKEGNKKDILEFALEIELLAIHDRDYTLLNEMAQRCPPLFYHLAKISVELAWPAKLDLLRELHDTLLELSKNKPAVLSTKKELRHDIRALFLNDINLPVPTQSFLQSRVEGFYQYKKSDYPKLLFAFLDQQPPEYIDTCKWLVQRYSDKWISRHGFYVHFLDNPSLTDLVQAYAHAHFDSEYLDPRLEKMCPDIEARIKAAIEIAGVSELGKDYRTLRRHLILSQVQENHALDAGAFISNP